MFGATVKGAAAAAKSKDQQEVEPERVYNLKRCCDLLLAGGYFRARISTLSPFDRVIGGLVWAITASNVDLDVDIVFQENSTIGQKIKLAENVIRALVKMGFPHQIQAQQIQGLDYVKLRDVIQWVLKQVFETRELTGDLVRALSESQFSKNYTLPEDVKPESAKVFVQTVVQQYKPKRQFKRKANTVIPSVTARTEATLLEYGEKFYRADTEEEESKDKGAAGAARKSSLISKFDQGGLEQKRKQEEEAKKKKSEDEQKRLDALKGGLAEVDVSADAQVNVGGIIDSSQIDYYDDELKRQQALAEKGLSPEEMGMMGKKALQAAFSRQVENVKKRISEQEKALQAKREAYDAVTQRTNQLRAGLADRATAKLQAEQRQQKLKTFANEHANQAVLAQLKALVQLNERLKRQESQFKASCKEQLTNLQGMMARLESDENDEEVQRMLEIEKLYDADLAKLNKLRQVLGQKNQEIARIVRAIDDIPTRAELIQYERRFVELYELVSEKLVETRKYFALYNTLEETHRFLTSEVSLLESIGQNFPKAVASVKGMDAFLESFKEIMENLQQNTESVQKTMSNEQSTRESLSEKYKVLLEKQRKYFKAVKEFQEECYKNEKLSDALQNAQRGQ